MLAIRANDAQVCLAGGIYILCLRVQRAGGENDIYWLVIFGRAKRNGALGDSLVRDS